VLKNNAGTVSGTPTTGTGDSVMATQPTFVTDLTTPIVYGSAAVSRHLVLQSTSNATRGFVQIVEHAASLHGERTIVGRPDRCLIALRRA
jgi:hypothetical protein